MTIKNPNIEVPAFAEAPSRRQAKQMNDPAASSGVSSFLLSRHSVLDTESSRVFWIPASAGMTNSRQAAGNEPEGIQNFKFLKHEICILNIRACFEIRLPTADRCFGFRQLVQL